MPFRRRGSNLARRAGLGQRSSGQRLEINALLFLASSLLMLSHYFRLLRHVPISLYSAFFGDLFIFVFTTTDRCRDDDFRLDLPMKAHRRLRRFCAA